MSVRRWALAAALVAMAAAAACARQKLKLEMSREVKVIPPAIESLEVDPSGDLDTRDSGRKITVTMRGDPELEATFDVKDRLRSRAMREGEPGVYTGTFEVQEGETGSIDLLARLLHPPSGALKEVRKEGVLRLYASPPAEEAPQAAARVPDAAEECEAQFRALTVHFAFNKFEIRPEEGARLSAKHGLLTAHPECLIHLHGHTDEIGTDQYNLELSRKRAEEVERFLVASGIPAGRIEVHAHGKTQPVDTSGTPEGQAQNRRVEFHAQGRD